MRHLTSRKVEDKVQHELKLNKVSLLSCTKFSGQSIKTHVDLQRRKCTAVLQHTGLTFFMTLDIPIMPHC